MLFAGPIKQDNHSNMHFNSIQVLFVMTIFNKYLNMIFSIPCFQLLFILGYKLSAVVYLNNTTGKGEVAQIAFHADESSQTYIDIFTAFKTMCNRDPPIILIDKDFTEIATVKKLFPTSTILLCVFHVLKWMKGVIRTAHRDKLESDNKSQMEEKTNLMTLFKKMMYAKTCADYEIRKVT